MSGREEGRVPEVSPGTDVGGYTVEAPLGEGGFGTVFRARRGGALYALKLLPLEEVGEWGMRELLNLAKVQHPHVVRLLGHGQWPDQAPRYFVLIMEYVPGRRLDVWASAENPSAREAVRKVLGLARALDALHAAKVVHRDVKEANTLVREADGEVVLVDLGVGGDEEAGWRTGGLLPPGTPDYRSPEAWRFERENQGVPGAHYRPTHSDDLYALGVVLYWLLTNRKPFHVEERKGVDAVLTQAPQPPHLLNPRVPLELSELCLRLLAKRPEDRPADARELCTALTALLERQEAPWDAPLCEAFSEHTVTTRLGPGGDEVAHYLKAAREAEARPRRGPRPLGGGEGTPRARRVSPRVAGGLILTVVVGGGMAWLWGSSPRLARPPLRSAEVAAGPRAGPVGDGLDVTWEVGRKVAPPWKPPEAISALSEQGEASMKDPQQKRQKGLGPVGKAITTGSACLTLACTGPQVRPEPPAEPCPPGAVEAMAGLDIDIGDKEDAVFTSGRTGRLISVKEGWASVEIISPLEELPVGSTLKGRLLFGSERVYGRFTEAQERKEGEVTGRSWPVCLDLLDRNGERGMALESGSTADTAKVWNSAQVRAVDRFQGG
jgi:serine/threonine-protein kinase